MASKVGIWNSCLIKLGVSGAGLVVNDVDDQKNANLCREQYDKLRQAELRKHTWNFAVGRQKLARLLAAPTFGFTYQYQLPSDWLRTIDISDNDGGSGNAPKYRIERDRTILSDASDIYLRYVADIDDPNVMDALFRESLAWAMAIDLAQPIAQSSSLRQEAEAGYDKTIASARSVDAIEDDTEEEPEGSWISERN